MTIPEITAYVMALPVEDVRRLTATEIMGWTMKNVTDYTDEQISYWFDGNVRTVEVDEWRPDIDRNQSRMVTDKVQNVICAEPKGNPYLIEDALATMDVKHSRWHDITPDQESRAALIAHMIHAEESKNDTN